MEIEEVQVKLEDEAKAGGDNSEKVLVDKEVFENLIRVLQQPTESALFYNEFYIVNSEHKVEYFDVCDEYGWDYSSWIEFYNEDEYKYAKKKDLLCKYLSGKSFEEIKKLGETSAPGLYYNGVKISDLL